MREGSPFSNTWSFKPSTVTEDDWREDNDKLKSWQLSEADIKYGSFLGYREKVSKRVGNTLKTKK